MKNNLEIGKLQFYWRMKKSINDKRNVIPDFVDFSFTFDSRHQLIKQRKNTKTIEYLNTIYKENFNVGYLQEGHALADLYGDDFLNYLLYAVENYNSLAKDISEIGAGGCYLLNKLKNKGYSVQAIDPSPISLHAGQRLGINVINDFYPSKKLKDKVDLIYHYDVLEHMEEPVSFINQIYNDLTDNGIMVIAVPDCSDYIKYGDISMILHEHINYFDVESLTNVVNDSKLKLIEVKKSSYGKVLYCIARKEKKYDFKNINSDNEKFILFSRNTINLKDKILKHIKLHLSHGEKIGFYIPLRALPYLSLLDEVDNKNIFRFFDDNSALKNTYFDGFEIPVENIDTLNEKPLDIIYVLSEAFGEIIKRKVLSHNNKIKVYTLEDFIQN